MPPQQSDFLNKINDYILLNKNPFDTTIIRVFVFIFFFVFASCTNNKKEIINQLDHLQEVLTTETAEDIKILYTDSGFLKAVLTSPKAVSKRGNENPYTEMPNGLKSVFFNQNKQVESTVSSEYGISYEKEQKVILRRNVDVVNIKNEKLNTEELIWDQKTKKIYTDKFVKITTPTEILTGYGLIADEDFSNWVIKKASGEFNLE